MLYGQAMVAFLVLFTISQCFSMWGQYVTLPYPSLTMWEAYRMAIPFAWASWLFMTFAIHLSHTYNLLTPTQDTFLLIVMQFFLIVVINHFYLKQPICASDFLAFVLILGGFLVSVYKLVTPHVTPYVTPYVTPE